MRCEDRAGSIPLRYINMAGWTALTTCPQKYENSTHIIYNLMLDTDASNILHLREHVLYYH